MKLKITIMLFAFCCFCHVPSFGAAVEDITLTVSSDGATKDDAVKNALRSAIEQAYGAFVSANTTILNDELLKDEVISVSTGSIKEYKELVVETNRAGNYYVVLNATVSLSNLIKYAQNHGSECEFAGNTFAMELKLGEMNKEAEYKILQNLLPIFQQYKNLWDYELELGEPKREYDLVRIPFKVKCLFNDNSIAFLNNYISMLQSIDYCTGEKEEEVGLTCGCISLLNKKSKRIIEKIDSIYYSRIDFVIKDNLGSQSQAEIDYYYSYGHEDRSYDDMIKSYYELYVESQRRYSRYASMFERDIKLLAPTITPYFERTIKKLKKDGVRLYRFPREGGKNVRYLYVKASKGMEHTHMFRGNINIPKSEIGKYSKFWVEPKN